MHGNKYNTKGYKNLCWVKTVRPNSKDSLGMTRDPGVDVYVRRIEPECGNIVAKKPSCNSWAKLSGKNLGGYDVFAG